jgi:hypothetical protein
MMRKKTTCLTSVASRTCEEIFHLLRADMKIPIRNSVQGAGHNADEAL